MVTLLRTLWSEPRRSPLRHWIFLVHEWAGVGVGLYFAMMGLTGSISVFLPELQNSLVAPTRTYAGNTPRIALQSLQFRIEQSLPSLRLQAVNLGLAAGQPDLFQEVASDGTVREIVIDQYDGHILANRRKGATFYEWARDLHANLLSGRIGRTVNGFGGILLLLTGLSGLVIWWPGRRHITRKAFRISAQKGWRRLSFDLHQLTGVLVVIPLCVLAMTGIYLAFPQFIDHAVTAVLGPKTRQLHVIRGQNKSVNSITEYANLDIVLLAAKHQLPGATTTRILAPSKRNDCFIVRMRLPGDWRTEGENLVLLDAHSADIRGVQLGRELAPASRLVAGMASIHYGQFGGTGTRFFTAIIGLACPLLYATGVVIWWRRVFRQRLSGSSPKVRAGSVHSVDLYANETR